MKTLAVILALLALPAFAAERTISWDYPTVNTDGTAIPASGPTAIASTQIEIGSCAGTVTDPVFGTVEGSAVNMPAPVKEMKRVFTPRPAAYCIRGRVKNADTFSAWGTVLRYVETVTTPGKIVIRITATVP